MLSIGFFSWLRQKKIHGFCKEKIKVVFWNRTLSLLVQQRFFLKSYVLTQQLRNRGTLSTDLYLPLLIKHRHFLNLHSGTDDISEVRRSQRSLTRLEVVVSTSTVASDHFKVPVRNCYSASNTKNLSLGGPHFVFYSFQNGDLLGQFLR